MAYGMNIEADIDEIATTRKAISKNLSDELEANLQAMRSSVSALDALWEGPNHDDFVRAFETRYKSLETFDKMLTTYIRAWRRAWQAYSACEDEVKGLIK